MARRTRLSRPPFIQGNLELNRWLTQVHDAINDLPNFSIVSTTDGPESNQTADPGTLLIDVGSAKTGSWVKQTGSGSTGWVELDNYAISSVVTIGDTACFAGLWTDEDLPELAVGVSLVTLNKFMHQSPYYQMSSSTTQGRLIVQSAGTYFVAFQSAFTGSPNVVFDAYITKNGIKTGLGTHRTATATGVGAFSIAPSIFTAAINDFFTINVKADAASKVFTNADAQFTAWKLR